MARCLVHRVVPKARKYLNALFYIQYLCQTEWPWPNYWFANDVTAACDDRYKHRVLKDKEINNIKPRLLYWQKCIQNEKCERFNCTCKLCTRRVNMTHNCRRFFYEKKSYWEIDLFSPLSNALFRSENSHAVRKKIPGVVNNFFFNRRLVRKLYHRSDWLCEFGKEKSSFRFFNIFYTI